MMKRIAWLFIPLALASFLGIRAEGSRPTNPEDELATDIVWIDEAYRLWQSLGNGIWPGWIDTAMPIVYIKEDREYAINFAKPLSGFQSVAGGSESVRTIQARTRTLAPNLAASFDIEGLNAVVMGTPAALEISPTEWVAKATHEMFHVFQGANGRAEKVASLGLGPRDDASWQLTFPFPYKSAEVMHLAHLQGYLTFLALNSQASPLLQEECAKDGGYVRGVIQEAITVYRGFLKQITGDERAYRYSQFQEWTEGVAAFAEYKIVEAAAQGPQDSSPAFRELKDNPTYQQLWEERYKNHIFLAKHAGRAARNRMVFYHLGLGKALLLDKYVPDWKRRYFDPEEWIDDIIAYPAGRPGQTPAIALGAPAPDFSLAGPDGRKATLKQSLGKVVLLDFWYTACPPCLQALPKLTALQERYRDEGLVIMGIAGRLDKTGLESVARTARDFSVNYGLWLDEKDAVANLYGVVSYPHVFLVDRDGKIAFMSVGYMKGDEVKLEEEIRKALAGR